MKDILERLKENQRWLNRDGFTTSANNARDAATEITTLREQVEKLTKERDDWKCRSERRVADLFEQERRHQDSLAALAEQNEKMREALAAMVDEARARNCGLKIADEAISLPDLATPVLNRIRAEGMRMAADKVDSLSALIPRNHTEIACLLRAKADELEKSL